MSKKIIFSLCILIFSSTRARDVLLEVKGSGFVPTNHLFKELYGKGVGMYGAELTGRLCKQVYGFVGVDALHKSGFTAEFATPTKVSVINVSFGLKCLAPFEYGDFYLGLGALPVHLKTQDDSSYVPSPTSKWGCGGIVKAGLLVDLPKNLFLDFFANYSFAKVHAQAVLDAPTQAQTAKINGCWFGLGLGYRFN